MCCSVLYGAPSDVVPEWFVEPAPVFVHNPRGYTVEDLKFCVSRRGIAIIKVLPADSSQKNVHKIVVLRHITRGTTGLAGKHINLLNSQFAYDTDTKYLAVLTQGKGYSIPLVMAYSEELSSWLERFVNEDISYWKVRDHRHATTLRLAAPISGEKREVFLSTVGDAKGLSKESQEQYEKSKELWKAIGS